MTDPETLRALLARVEGAAGADLTLLLAVWRAFDLNEEWRDDNSETENAETEAYEQFYGMIGAEACTDAILVLLGRTMPRCSIAFRQDKGEKWIVNLWKPGKLHAIGVHTNSGLALLAALLRAKIAETDND